MTKQCKSCKQFDKPLSCDGLCVDCELAKMDKK